MNEYEILNHFHKHKHFIDKINCQVFFVYYRNDDSFELKRYFFQMILLDHKLARFFRKAIYNRFSCTSLDHVIISVQQYGFKKKLFASELNYGQSGTIETKVIDPILLILYYSHCHFIFQI